MNFEQAMEHRFACKKYLDKDLEQEKLEKILTYGRLTPTAFGLEGWAFHVVTTSHRGQLAAACFDQESVLMAPVSIVLVSYTADSYDPRGPFVAQRASRFGALEPFIEDYEGYYQFLKKAKRLDSWSLSQCYLAAANMMTGAKMLGVDSCALEGFDNDRVLGLLGLSQKKYQVALVIPFGYAAQKERPKIRMDMGSLVTYH
ncbi:MAG: nitroreductase family protein [Sphaerochaeta sp.]